MPNSKNSNLRCPLPPVGADPDSLRQFEGSQTPKSRVFPAIPQTSGTAVTETGGGSSSSSSGGGGSAATAVTSKTVVVSINTLVFSAYATVPISRSFQLLYISSNRPVCVRLYGSATARQLDAGRQIDAPAPAEVTQGMIIDTVLDTSPFLWLCQNIMGSNQDTNQVQQIYLNALNINPETQSGVQITLCYVPLET
jgi:hypothetical protein